MPFGAPFDSLPERARKVFWLHRVDDLSYAQIAAMLGITIEEVQTEIANALYGIDRLLREARPTDREPPVASHPKRQADILGSQTLAPSGQ